MIFEHASYCFAMLNILFCYDRQVANLISIVGHEIFEWILVVISDLVGWKPSGHWGRKGKQLVAGLSQRKEKKGDNDMRPEITGYAANVDQAASGREVDSCGSSMQAVVGKCLWVPDAKKQNVRYLCYLRVHEDAVRWWPVSKSSDVPPLHRTSNTIFSLHPQICRYQKLSAAYRRIAKGGCVR